MNPEVFRKWQEARQCVRGAERHLADDAHEKAELEARRAVATGLDAFIELYPTPQDLERIGFGYDAWTLFYGGGRVVSALDYVNGAKKLLRQLVNLLPAENKPWDVEDL